MIPYNFEYYRPATLHEAVSLFQQLDAHDKSPLYYSGGTEIITLGRINQVYTGAVIDLKQIPECRMLAVLEQKMVLGSALTLSELHDSRVFPLLGETGAGVADRTSRNKITFGGNICGRFIYKEAVLPLLLTDSEVRIAGPTGFRQVPIGQVFDRTLKLSRGEFLVQALTEVSYIGMPYVTVKKRKVASIDYPLVTVTALRSDSGIRVAFSGVCSFPFRSAAVEEILNRREIPLEDRINQAADQLPAPILSDIKGSAAYRKLVLKNTLHDTIRTLGGG
ncbi:FAD binding domain-containing protein [Paenibacillus validus]|uniref:Xanthine dehydrogenase n=1 Tax=Paenibacillus validus TaxID=44253 RepID=A0A7X2ZAW9_9BACL|nr:MULTISPECIES: FAD binding domain-containing protein [Paenibacillus]MED4599204.1 FAD binding domain-containing protein [Paenibacillus validus]MED4606489.1 FAD binding domain-containing protein [Paenibacillus validus]MUG71548.1 xanthine dehydrogenase [Paenibacillus validus]